MPYVFTKKCLFDFKFDCLKNKLILLCISGKLKAVEKELKIIVKQKLSDKSYTLLNHNDVVRCYNKAIKQYKSYKK